MVSSTFKDLIAHRQALIDALNAHDLHPNVMENDSAKLVDVLDSSLQMVRDSAAYIGLIGFRYGQTLKDSRRNPEALSVTELEFDEAQHLKRPILLFIMGEDHPVKKADVEQDSANQAKLDAFRERAKRKSPDSAVPRVYAVFNSLEEFKEKIAPSLHELCQYFDAANVTGPENARSEDTKAIPTPPAFYAEPPYIGSHEFVGREAQLLELSDWAQAADPTNLLLYEAIGGNGKSMLTWEWVTKHSAVRADWAGRFWYSFYEKGALMADFCRRALAYMTGRPLEEFARKKTVELAEDLLAECHRRPWLLILDGLERVLVAYHRIDAAELPDEEANRPTDQIADRNPRDAIREEDNDLLRALAAASPSKILVSSRLTPRVLLNASDQPINGVKRITLPGLRPPDAEKLLRSCGVQGDSAEIQKYLSANCDNHPLVIGVLGGLINNYLPNRGNFDAWVNDPEGGGGLDLGSLDLVQRRNHILRASLDALPSASRELLFTLALVPESVEYDTLRALNPFLPTEPKRVEKPEPPEGDGTLSDERNAAIRKRFEAALARYQDYEKAEQTRPSSREYREAPKKLEAAVHDLEQRGFLQYDRRARRHDLHPVVRSVIVGRMQHEDKERYGGRVVDHFSSLPHSPYEKAEALEDLRPSRNIVRTLLRLGHFQQAAAAYRGDLANALLYNVEAYEETLSLLRPFFPNGWKELPKDVEVDDGAYLANEAAVALYNSDEERQALSASGAALRAYLESEHWSELGVCLRNIANCLSSENRLAEAFRVHALALDLATVTKNREGVFLGQLSLFFDQCDVGQWAEAESTWQELDPMGRDWSRPGYRPGSAERCYARLKYFEGTLEEAHLSFAERMAAEGKNRANLRFLHQMRGAWRLDQGASELAAASFTEALRMARESAIGDVVSETGLALAKHHLGQLDDPHREAKRLAQQRYVAHRRLAQLWLALGERERAISHAVASYKSAWCDGEPYVRRYELNKTVELLRELNVPIPNLPPYDPSKHERFPWEDEVEAAIQKLRGERSDP